MKKIIKLGAILMAVAILVTAGVYAAATRTYTWQATTSVQFDSVDTFATVTAMSWSLGKYNKTDGVFAISGVATNNDEFKTYDADGRPYADVTAKNWTIAGTQDLTDDKDALKITFSIKNDNPTKGLNVTVTIKQSANLTGLIVKNATNAAVSTSVEGVAQTLVEISASQTSVFTYYIIVGDYTADITATSFEFLVSMVSA